MVIKPLVWDVPKVVAIAENACWPANTDACSFSMLNDASNNFLIAIIILWLMLLNPDR